ncbi:hypothetical protein C8Q75DRAFT_804411 [Abortiporus biennis]|nr:hypothetical protein C8Q75DRAFT_804411 [Abortiporus biennis]
MFIPPGSICWSDFASEASYFQCEANYDLLERIEEILETTKAVLITDEVHLLIVDTSSLGGTYNFVVFKSFCLSEHCSIRLVIGALLYDLDGKPWQPMPHPLVVQGAMNQRYEPIRSRSHEGWEKISPLPFRNFDHFTLQRSLPALKDFLEWKEEESSRLNSYSFNVDTMFEIKTNCFTLGNDVTFLLQSSFPMQSLPKETIESVSNSFRPRDNTIDAILDPCFKPNSDINIFFKVTQVVRHEPDVYFQIFIGVLCTKEGIIKSHPLYLKLFIEGMFPIDEERLLNEYDEDHISFKEDPSKRLSSLYFADDMIKRERFAHDRLRSFEGTLLPHCYGFHIFTVGNVSTSYGMLLEVIPGLPLRSILPKVDEWNPKRQTAFLHHLRNCLRVFRYAGLDQKYISSGLINVILPQDFGFAFPRLGDEQEDGIVAPYFGGSSWGEMMFMFIDHVKFSILDLAWIALDLEEI